MMGGYGWGGGSGAWGWGAMLFMMFLGLLVLVGIILLIVWAVRQGEDHRAHPSGHGQQQHYGGGAAGQQWTPSQPGTFVPHGQGGGAGRDPAVDAARERYARGEITKEQLDQIMRDLGH